MKSLTESASIMWYNFRWFQPHAACDVWDVEANIWIKKLFSCSSDWVISYTGIQINCLSVFKLGQVFALFSRVMQLCLAKSINSFDSAKFCTSHRESARAGLHNKQPWLARMYNNLTLLLVESCWLATIKDPWDPVCWSITALQQPACCLLQ